MKFLSTGLILGLILVGTESVLAAPSPNRGRGRGRRPCRGRGCKGGKGPGKVMTTTLPGGPVVTTTLPVPEATGVEGGEIISEVPGDTDAPAATDVPAGGDNGDLPIATGTADGDLPVGTDVSGSDIPTEADSPVETGTFGGDVPAETGAPVETSVVGDDVPTATGGAAETPVETGIDAGNGNGNSNDGGNGNGNGNGDENDNGGDAGAGNGNGNGNGNGADTGNGDGDNENGGNNDTGNGNNNGGDAGNGDGNGNNGNGDGGNGGNGGAGDSALALDPTNVQENSSKTGQEENDDPAQADSLTDGANFINFCTGKTLTNGLQVKAGSCNGIPMGDIPSTTNMVSSLITFPGPGEDIAADTTFDIKVKVLNLVAGSFTNPAATYYAAPQFLQGGKIVGHTHVTVQKLESLNPTSPPDPAVFEFFKGINDVGDGNGNLQATVTSGLPAGFYRVCTMSSSSNHQPVLMPVAQRGAQDDCQKFSVGQGGNAGNANGQQNGGQ